MTEHYPLLEPILAQYFDWSKTPLRAIKPINDGLIHRTFKVTVAHADGDTAYILQQINTRIFKNPDILVQNHLAVAAYFLEKKWTTQADFSLPTLLKTRTNHYLARHPADGEVWRLTSFFENTICLSANPSPHVARLAARAFAKFHETLWDMDTAELGTPIVDFLNFEQRLAQFQTALAHASADRRAVAEAEILYLQKQQPIAEQFVAAVAKKQISQRVIHADPKWSNVLFDNKLAQVVAIIDLDTLMVGPLLYDFGDMVRAYSNTKAEDDPAPDGIFDPQCYAALTAGYCEVLSERLSAAERLLLPLAGQAVVYVQAMRFLTDFLDNDRYYQVRHDLQNLHRAQNQLHHLRVLQQQLD